MELSTKACTITLYLIIRKHIGIHYMYILQHYTSWSLIRILAMPCWKVTANHSRPATIYTLAVIWLHTSLHLAGHKTFLVQFLDSHSIPFRSASKPTVWRHYCHTVRALRICASDRNSRGHLYYANTCQECPYCVGIELKRGSTVLRDGADWGWICGVCLWSFL